VLCGFWLAQRQGQIALRPKKVIPQCELPHRRRPFRLFICRRLGPLVRALGNAHLAPLHLEIWVIAMGVFHRTAMLCSWFIESTMSGCTERFRVR